MNKEHRLMLAGHAVQGLLASNNTERGYELGSLAVLSLKVADAILHFDAQGELPSLVDSRDEEDKPNIITPSIITP